MSDVALGRHDTDDFPALIELNFGFRKIEVHRAAPVTLVPQDAAELFHLLEHRRQFGIALYLRRVSRNQNSRDGGVGHPFPAAQDPFREAAVEDIAPAVYLHQNGKDQPVFPGLEAADSA